MKNVQTVYVGATGVQAAGSAVTAIAANKVGLVDVSTGLTVATISDAVGSFYFYFNGKASQLFENATGVATTAAYNAAVDKKITVSPGAVSCETEYMLKIRFEGEAIAKSYGYNDLVKTFSFTTGCCDDCSTDCPTGDCDELTAGLMAAINADTDNLLTATVVTNAETGCKDLVIEGATATAPAIGCGPEAMFVNQTVVNFFIGLAAGFDCNGASQSDTIDLEFASGEPFQVAAAERWAEGYTREFGMYRTPFPYTVADVNAVGTATYDMVTGVVTETYKGAATLNPVVSGGEITIAATSTANATAVAGLFA